MWRRIPSVDTALPAYFALELFVEAAAPRPPLLALVEVLPFLVVVRLFAIVVSSYSLVCQQYSFIERLAVITASGANVRTLLLTPKFSATFYCFRRKIFNSIAVIASEVSWKEGWNTTARPFLAKNLLLMIAALTA